MKLIDLPNTNQTPEINKLIDRDFNLDLLRVIGICLIFIAHSNPPAWLFQLRNFGTPLLIIASALTYSKIYIGKKINIKEFYIKRILRLIIPTWIFLSLLFISIYIFNYSENYEVSLKFIVESFLLSGGKVPYLFIFKVYIFLALITPGALYFKSCIRSTKKYYFSIFIYFIFYEILSIVTPFIFNAQVIKLLDNNLFCFIAYSVFYMYGLRLNEIPRKVILIISVCSLMLFVIIASYKFYIAGHFIQTQTDKHPPHVYYMSYAFFSVNVIYLICTGVLHNFRLKKIITWCSSNSLWIFLWHIMGIELFNNIGITFYHAFISMLLMFVFITAFAVIVTLIQKKLVDIFFIKTNNKMLIHIATYLK